MNVWAYRAWAESVTVAGTQGSAWPGQMSAGWSCGHTEEKPRALGSLGYKTRRTRGTRLQGQWRRSEGRRNQGQDVLKTVNRQLNRDIYALVLVNFGESFFICKFF